MVARKIATEQLANPAGVILLACFGQEVGSDVLASAIARVEIEGEGFDGGAFPTLLDAAVASVLLRGVQDELPRWLAAGSDVGNLGNAKSPPDICFATKHLFTLNWADSAPGFSWPTAYYATPVPRHQAVVITASDDTSDASGFKDFAIGSVPAGTELVAGAREVILEHWESLKTEGQDRWEYVVSEGLVTGAEAEKWAEVVWADSEQSE